MTNTADKKLASADAATLPAADTGVDVQNRIDLNDPTLTEEEAVAKNLGLSAAKD